MKRPARLRIDRQLDQAIHTWESQAWQYPRLGDSGIRLRLEHSGGGLIHCLLWRDPAGLLRGVLNHYPVAHPPYERAGNVNLWVDPAWTHQGIASALIRDANTRWTLDPHQQRYSTAGAAVVARLLQENLPVRSNVASPP